MNIGNKIKELRTEKMMTQSELAGGEITRNMLSQIENGVALPSLSTITYLAKKLGVPAGYLLSDGADEFIYKKTRVMQDVKRAYKDKNFSLCKEICATSFDEFDDEIELILTECCIGYAEEHLKAGKLHEACKLLDEALLHASKTIYSTVTQHNRVKILFCLLKDISPVLDSDVIDIDDEQDTLYPELFGDVFSKYISIISEGVTKDSHERVLRNVTDLTEHDKLFVAHLKAKQFIFSKEYKKAQHILSSIMDGDTPPQRLLLFLCCSDMEKCCKEMEDFKGAYEFSINRLEILEHMLAEG
jgi:transcriptional regulator with XRE-family HTH domain